MNIVGITNKITNEEFLSNAKVFGMQGDTELGLGVKNTMDSMDWEDLPVPLRLLLQSISLMIEKLQKRGESEAL